MRSIDENYLEYVRVKQESQHIVQQAYKNIEHLSKGMKKQDEKNQTVLTQMYLIEMMIENLKEECHFHLGGKYSEAVNDELKKLKQSISRVNDKWEDFRKSFLS